MDFACRSFRITCTAPEKCVVLLRLQISYIKVLLMLRISLCPVKFLLCLKHFASNGVRRVSYRSSSYIIAPTAIHLICSSLNFSDFSVVLSPTQWSATKHTRLLTALPTAANFPLLTFLWPSTTGSPGYQPEGVTLPFWDTIVVAIS